MTEPTDPAASKPVTFAIVLTATVTVPTAPVASLPVTATSTFLMATTVTVPTPPVPSTPVGDTFIPVSIVTEPTAPDAD